MLHVINYLLVITAVNTEIALNQCVFQAADDHETDNQGQKQGIQGIHVEKIHKYQRKNNRCCHADEEEQGNLLVVLTDGHVQHGIKYEGQGHIAAEAGENINDIYLAHEILPEAEGKSQQEAQGGIHEKSQIEAGQNIIIFFLFSIKYNSIEGIINFSLTKIFDCSFLLHVKDNSVIIVI